jgi:hypothetical protein
MQIPVLIDWSPFSDHIPAHSSSNKSGWGIKSSVAEHSLSLQNKERVKESKICCTRGRKKKAIWNRISLKPRGRREYNRNKNQSRSQKHAIFVCAQKYCTGRTKPLRRRFDLIFVLAGAGLLLAFVDLFVSSQVGHDREMTTAAFDITCVR